jgi:hypothetical protein
MDLAFDDMLFHWSVLGLNRGRGQLGVKHKSVFLAVNASLSWLNIVSGVYILSPGFLASYLSAGFGTGLQLSALASHWLEDYANLTPTLLENDYYSANHS